MRTRRATEPLGDPDAGSVRDADRLAPHRWLLPFCCYEPNEARLALTPKARNPAAGAGFRHGRYWARTSDPQLVEFAWLRDWDGRGATEALDQRDPAIRRRTRWPGLDARS